MCTDNIDLYAPVFIYLFTNSTLVSSWIFLMQFMHESADLNCKAFAVSPVDLIHLLTLISAFICFTVSQ